MWKRPEIDDVFEMNILGAVISRAVVDYASGFDEADFFDAEQYLFNEYELEEQLAKIGMFNIDTIRKQANRMKGKYEKNKCLDNSSVSVL